MSDLASEISALFEAGASADREHARDAFVRLRGALAAGTPALDRSGRRELKAEMERSSRLDVAVARGNSFRAALHRLADELDRGERTLADAVVELGQESVTHDRAWVAFALKAHPGLTREQVLAKRLLDTVEEHRKLQSRALPVSLDASGNLAD